MWMEMMECISSWMATKWSCSPCYVLTVDDQRMGDSMCDSVNDMDPNRHLLVLNTLSKNMKTNAALGTFE